MPEHIFCVGHLKFKISLRAVGLQNLFLSKMAVNKMIRNASQKSLYYASYGISQRKRLKQSYFRFKAQCAKRCAQNSEIL